jgi:ligand-binding SRPBCC domain-containing protein
VQRFTKKTEIQAPVEKVFAFHLLPDALERISPPEDKLEILERPAALEIGARIVIRTWLGPFRRLWVAEVVEFVENRLFADIQKSGPFAHWYHRHRFEPTERDTTMYIDEIDYALPLGWVGRVLSSLAVRPRLERMFEYRHRAVARILNNH